MKNVDEKINFNSKVIKRIIEQTSTRKNPVDYIMKMFSTSKVTAYRRIKNETPFTLEETVAIAEDLGLSIDKLLDLKLGDNFKFAEGSYSEPEDIYLRFLSNDIKTMETLHASKNVEIVAALNRLPFWLLPYKSLFRFNYCHYLYSTGKISLMTRYSDIVVPEHINNLHEKASSYLNRLKNVTCIIDGRIHLDIIKKIQYYSRLKIISAEDLEILQNELFELLKTYESLLRNGRNSFGSEYTFYYSIFPIDSNIVFLRYDDNYLLQIWIYPERPVEIVKSHIILDLQKRWIDSKIRNSTLITKTNDTQHIEMLRNVYHQVSELNSQRLMFSD